MIRNNEPWFIAKDVCDILGTRTDTVRQIVGNKRVATVNPNLIGVGNHGGRDILIVNEAGLHHCTGGVAFRKEADSRMMKVRVSDLDSTFKEFFSNLRKTSQKGGRPQEYVYFITRHGVARLNVDNIHIRESTVAPFLF